MSREIETAFPLSAKDFVSITILSLGVEYLEDY